MKNDINNNIKNIQSQMLDTINSKNVVNFSKEIAKKVSESKAMVTSNYSFDNSFYILLTKKAATPSNLNRLRRNVGNNPNYQFMDAVEFHKLFED